MSPEEDAMEDWPDIVGALIACSGSDEFPKQLIDWLYQIATAGEKSPAAAWIMFNRRGYSPKLQYQTSVDVERQRIHDFYLRTYYILDPTYKACVESEKSGLFSIDELAPDEFQLSEYFQEYYVREGLSDEVNFLFSVSTEAALNISLVVRPPNDGKFNDAGLKRLRRLEPVVRQLAFLHWKPAALNNEIESSDASAFHKQLQDGYQNFGASCLTPREREVVHLMLQGHSRNSASVVMGVSPSTIKEHRKNIYLKLDVSSHGELFALFFEALKHSDGRSEDPLANYLGA